MDRFFNLFNLKGSITMVTRFEPTFTLTFIPDTQFSAGMDAFAVWKNKMVALGYKPETVEQYALYLNKSPLCVFGADVFGNVGFSPAHDRAIPTFGRNEITDYGRVTRALTAAVGAAIKVALIQTRAAGGTLVLGTDPVTGEKTFTIGADPSVRSAYATTFAKEMGLFSGDTLPEYRYAERPAISTCLVTAPITGDPHHQVPYYYPISMSEISSFPVHKVVVNPQTYDVPTTKARCKLHVGAGLLGEPAEAFFRCTARFRALSNLVADTAYGISEVPQNKAKALMKLPLPAVDLLKKLAYSSGFQLMPGTVSEEDQIVSYLFVPPDATAPNSFILASPLKYRVVGVGLGCDTVAFDKGAIASQPFLADEQLVVFADPQKVYLGFPAELFSAMVNVVMADPKTTATKRTRGADILKRVAPFSAQRIKIVAYKNRIMPPASASHGLSAYATYAKMCSRTGKPNEWDNEVFFGKSTMGEADFRLHDRASAKGGLKACGAAPSLLSDVEESGTAFQAMCTGLIPWYIEWDSTFVPRFVDPNGKYQTASCDADRYKLYLLRGYPAKELSMPEGIPMPDEKVKIRYIGGDESLTLSSIIANLEEETDAGTAELKPVPRTADYALSGYIDPTSVTGDACARAWMSQSNVRPFYEDLALTALGTGAAVLNQLMVLYNLGTEVVELEVKVGDKVETMTISGSGEYATFGDAVMTAKWSSGAITDNAQVALVSPYVMKCPLRDGKPLPTVFFLLTQTAAKAGSSASVADAVTIARGPFTEFNFGGTIGVKTVATVFVTPAFTRPETQWCDIIVPAGGPNENRVRFGRDSETLIFQSAWKGETITLKTGSAFETQVSGPRTVTLDDTIPIKT